MRHEWLVLGLVFFVALGARVDCTQQVQSQGRPSLSSLQQQVDDLHALLTGGSAQNHVPHWSGDALVSGNLYDDGARVGIGTSDPQAELHLANRSFLITGTTGDDVGARLVVDSGASTSHTLLWLKNADGTGLYVDGLPNSGGKFHVGIGTETPSRILDVAGTTRTEIVEIIGGSDIAEPFPTEEGIEIPAGALLVIDQEHPGQLKLSEHPYDQRVAGVVSGAGGVQPGLTLTQEEIFEGGRNVSLTGRVFALADASRGAIHPGDLLTTSSIPGHAMKAADRERSHGAVIGKAMSSLESGRGLVLVLVNLQ